jgi:hypothetical protein
VILKSNDKNRSEDFVVLACSSGDGNVIGTVVSDASTTLENIVTSFKEQGASQGRGSDQISRFLRAGSSVSVALRLVGLREKPPALGFVLDNTIAPKGHLLSRKSGITFGSLAGMAGSLHWSALRLVYIYTRISQIAE